MTRPTRDTPDGRAYQDVRNLARRDGRDVAEYLTLYALEGFLARLAASPHADDFVLKGGVLMAAFAARRPTRDIDLAASGFPNDVDEVVMRVGGIIRFDAGDGLMFDPASVAGVPIRDEADYTGVRVKVAASLATARIALHVDVNFGDPIWPAPTQAEVPRLLGGSVRLKGYPDHMVLAEKIVTAVERGTANTRWRDFVDIVALSQTRTIRMSDMAEAIRTVAAYREASLRPLDEVLDGMASLAQAKWVNWRRKQRLDDSTPEQFQELLDQVIRFADPALEGTAELTWTPESQAWRAVSVSSTM
ncbi:nucleotidyl transferase AbiEii/AbiGii toxin family protein [Promicromonospora aerolata]|uniref:Nucleotidyl transferase AbiEii/AbiGii toxin family protein n=1 Tax=Promicromonospora aerolata TaxID=195749 RepID=A0ABW4V501_9MICO